MTAPFGMKRPAHRAEPNDPATGASLLGTSPAMRSLRADVARAASTSSTILLTGPTGAGKEAVARALHGGSPRAGAPFEAINCGAIPAHLAESELFGAEAGAFTGATRRRVGRVELASSGTLFLDEVGDLPLDLQVKLLRVLETREVTRLGGGAPVPVDIRVIAATNRDLEAMVAAGSFREDLYWRLAVLWLDVPPLADRAGDIPELVAHFAAASGAVLALTPCGEAALARHSWPGNVRELRNFVERALVHATPILDAEAVLRLLSPRRRPMAEWLGAAPAPAAAALLRAQAVPPPLIAEGELRPLVLRALLQEAEEAIIRHALETTGGTVASSARLLGLKRTTLVEKMRRMGLSATMGSA
jgi:DNA-binding NtrC family response regulator